MTQTTPLQFRSNACPLCLTCLVCTEVYGQNCTCPPKELKWKRKSNEYKIDFRHKSLDMVAARKQKIKLDNLFVNWFHSNISLDLKISEDQHDANVCRRCINKYDYYKKSMYFYIVYEIFFVIMSCYLFISISEDLNQPKTIKSKSDLASETIIDLDNNSNTFDTIDLTKQSPLKTLSPQDLNILETKAMDIPIQNKRQKQKQIVPSKLFNKNYYRH